MESYQGIFLLGFIGVLCIGSSAQDLSYGQKMISLSRLSKYAEISQLLTSDRQNGVANALDELVGNWKRTLFRTGRNGQQYSISQYNVSSTCMKHLNLTVTHINEKWAQRMIDSLPKGPSGFLNGNLLWTGSYDECVNETAVIYVGPNQTNPTHPFKGQYCRVGIPLSPVTTFTDIGAMAFMPGTLVVGLCVPSTCSESDVFNLINAALSYIPSSIHIGPANFTLQAQKALCQKDELEYDATATGVTVMFSILLVLVILGTLYDVLVVHKLHLDAEEPFPGKPGGGLLRDDPPENDESSNIKYRVSRPNEHSPLLGGTSDMSIQAPHEQGLAGKVLIAFSVYTNGSKLLSAKRQPGTLGALNGVRFLSMSWVILGHSFAFAAFIGSNVGSFILEIQSRFTYMAITNATVAVDTFFVISGLLVAYLTLKELQRVGGARKFKWGLFYFHRFWRLTPPYMLVIALYIPLMRYWYNGPMWPQSSIEVNFCKDTWWKNILYINNFFKSTDTCMVWSWYLANDMQFYVISPLFLILLYYSRFLGVIVCVGFLLMSCIVSGTLSSVHNYPLGVFGGGGDPREAGSYFDDYYVRPYCRIGAYVIGMLYGYILYAKNCKVRMKKAVSLLCWILAAICCLSVLYGPYGTTSGKAVASRDVIALYTALNRPVWALGVSWVIFACATGHGGIVNWFLSWKLFIPLSRLTYLAYLIHPVVLEVYYQGQRDGFYLNDFNLSYLFVAHLVVANAVAFFLSLVFESPFMGLEKAILKRERKH